MRLHTITCLQLTRGRVRKIAARIAALTAAFALSSGLTTPPVADACGGTFCDGPQGMAIDQRGESVLFVLDGDRVEAHIQIEYDPQQAPASFAWVIPLTALPEFSVGSQPLFDRLLAATVPFYGLTDTSEFCGPSEGDDFSEDSGSGFKLDAGQGGDSGGPEVVHTETVGAFEVTVRPRSPRGLKPAEQRHVLEVLRAEEYVDKAPETVFAELLDQGIYLCSARTMYRLLRANNELRERRDQRRHPSYARPELLATAPRQVWS